MLPPLIYIEPRGGGKPPPYPNPVFRSLQKHPYNPQLHRVTRGLFDRHGFCEIAGLIDIAAAFERHIIGEQLQRNHIE